MRRTVIAVIAIIVIAAVAFVLVRQRQASQSDELEIIREATVNRDQITATVSATGSIEPEALVTLSFGVAGTVQQVNVVRGQLVEPGFVMATLDTEELALNVQQAEDALRIQELSLEQAQNSVPSPATLASAQADIDAAEGNLQIAQANLSAARASLTQAQAQRQKLDEGPTEGQIAAAEAQVASATLQQKAAQTAYDRTIQCFTVTLPDGKEEERCPGLGPAEEQARANLENANAALTAAESQLADLQTGPSDADTRAANAAVAAAQAQVESAQGNVTVAQANLDRARAAYDRLQEGPSEAELAILQAQVASAETSRDLAQLRLDQAMIIAPISGRVASVLISQGEQATPGAPATTVVNEEGFHLEVNVDEIDIDQIAVGQEVEITLDALPDQVIKGTIAEIAPTAATSGVGVVTYLVSINLNPSDVELRPGMTANASIVVEQMDNVLVVPNWAVRLDRETGRAFVNRRAADGTIEEVTVETGLRNEQFSEVLSGLAEGDVVVVTNERQGLESFFGS